MIPEEHLPAVRMVCDYLIHAAYHTMADVTDFTEWVAEDIRECYNYKRQE